MATNSTTSSHDALAIRKARTFTEDLVELGDRRYDGFDHKCKGCNKIIDNAGAMRRHIRGCRDLDKIDIG